MRGVRAGLADVRRIFGHSWVLRDALLWTAVVGVLTVASRARAEAPYGAVVRPTRIEVLSEAPLRVRIVGAFARWDGTAYGATVEGATEFRCPEGEESLCRLQWARMSTKSCYGLGWELAPPPVAASPKLPPLSLWATARGVRVVDTEDVVCLQLSTPESVKEGQTGAGHPDSPTPYSVGDPVPPGYRVVTSNRHGLIVAGSIVFGVLYGLSVTGGVAGGREYASFYVPVIGPFIVASRFGFDSGFASLVSFFLVIDGVGQAAGIGMFVAGFTTKMQLVRSDVATVRVAPLLSTTQMGLGLFGSF